MTVPSLASGAVRRAASVVSAIAVAAVLALGTAASAQAAPVLGATASRPAENRPAADPTPSPTPTPLSGTVDATLAPVGEGVVASGDPLNAWVSVQNGTADTLAKANVTLQLGSAPITTRSALSSWLKTTTAASGFASVAKGTINPVASGATGQSLLIVSADNKALKSRKPGVYPLQAVAATSAGNLVSTSVMIVPDAAQQSTDVGVIVPITAPGIQTGLLTPEQLTALTAPTGDLTARVNAVDGTDAILAIDPAIVASIRVLGSSAPTSARDWLRHLMSLPNTRFALQFGDADTAAQITANGSLLEPTSLQAYLNADNFQTPQEQRPTPPPGATTSASPSPTATPGGVQLPDLHALLDIGPARANVFWPFSGTASGTTVKTLGALGDTATPAETIVSSAQTGSVDATVPAEARTNGRGMLVFDSSISEQLTVAAQDGTEATQGAPLTAATAQLQLAGASAAGASLLTVIDRTQTLTESGLRAAILAVTKAPSVRAAVLSDYDSSTAASRAIKATVKDGRRVTAVTALELGEQQLIRFATILTDPTVLTGTERAQIMQLIGGGWIGVDAWQNALRDHAAATQTTLKSVGILPLNTVNIAGTGATLRFWVRNDLPWPVHVNLTAATDDPRFEVPAKTAVTGTASSNTRVELPMHAKVTNGQTTLTLQLRSPTGVAIGEAQTVQVSMHADWEMAGIVILGIIVVVLLVAGAGRMVFSRRRAKKQEAEEIAAAQAAIDAQDAADQDAPASDTDVEKPAEMKDDA
ncbi:DUF6049 family protein [Microbacterium mangrovi]|uniref:DUF6049 family protein n=1 Tax=Microbacterium mangrovi TaxID=1348253 RepID=UPI00068BD59E|nr:DUF6049 family protein [Microbacterium mangrovi]